MNSETPKKYIEKLLSEVLGRMYTTGEITILPTAEVTVPEAAFGDYSSNVGLRLSKELKQNPKILAENIGRMVASLDQQKKLESVSEAGGFINFKLSQNTLLENINTIVSVGNLYGCSMRGEGKTVIVEYFQNNVAKPPHVGHLRSAVIGDCLVRIFKSQGYKTVSDTHIGDWGVQFGVLILAYKTLQPDGQALEENPIEELNRLYVEMSEKIEADPALRDQAKAEFKKLEDGDEQNRKLWQWFVDESLKDFERYRILLDVLPFDYNLGESFYQKHMPEVLAEFQEKKLITTGETGELYIDLEAYNLGRCILVKSDGATTYHLRDFATYIYRKKQFNFYKNIYEVDSRQSHHFRQLFQALELAGYPAFTDSVHVEHGFMSLPEGAISTRKGTVISLENLVSEAEKKALEIIEQKNPDLENKVAISKKVALSAIKYFDLSHNHKSEIIFTWDKALSFEGNTGPYLQYTHARIQGILRKSQIPNPKSQINYNPPAGGQISNFKPEELSVLRKLVKFPEIVAQVSQDYLPNLLCNYLFELSQEFNVFYQEVPVLQETDEQLKEFRLQLITATAQVLSNGLYLLGIEAPEEM